MERYMTILKKAVIILSLLIPSLAHGYTYQDVENAYNSYKTQYPNDYIWIEEFSQDGQKGYKIWKRPESVKNKIYTRSIVLKNGKYKPNNPPTSWRCCSNYCDGQGGYGSFTGGYYDFRPPASNGTIEYTDVSCSGNTTVSSHFLSPFEFPGHGISDPCHVNTTIITNCKSFDVLLATFFPITDYTLQTVSGSGQSGSINKTITDPFTVNVVDNNGNPQSGITIHWQITNMPTGATGQTLTASDTITGNDGTTGAYLTLGSRPGTYTVVATCSECTSGSPQTFTATAVGHTIEYISGDGQTGSVGQSLKEPFIVMVTDKDNMPVVGAGIQWNITSTPAGAAGVGLTNTMLSTGSDGMASSTLILGDKEGEYTVGASCEECSTGSPVTFTATAIGVKIELTLSKTEALPDENITVTVKATKGITGEPEPNYPINIEDRLEPKGHDHYNDPPQWKKNGNTDANGIFTTTYSKSISGNVTITAISGKNTEIRDSKNLTVWINLSPLGEGTNYILTGAYNQTRCNGTTVTSQHNSNHYGKTALNDAIINISNDYAARYPGVRLRINDMSLQWGGLFDIYNSYQPPHDSHRFGRNADIETAGVNSQGQCVSLKLPKLYSIIEDKTKNPPRDEGNHYHITVK